MFDIITTKPQHRLWVIIGRDLLSFHYIIFTDLVPIYDFKLVLIIFKFVLVVKRQGPYQVLINDTVLNSILNKDMQNYTVLFTNLLNQNK